VSTLVLLFALAQAQTDMPLAEPAPPKELVPVTQGGLTAQKCADRAAEPSPAVEAARQQLNSAAAQVDQAFYSFFPRLAGRAAYNRLSHVDAASFGPPGLGFVVTQAPAGMPVAGGISSGPVAIKFLENQTTFAATLSVPLSDYVLRISRASDAAKAAREGAEFNLKATQAKASSDAQINFYNWLRALGAVTVAEQTLDDQKQHYQDTKVLFDAGAASKADLLRADAQVQAAEQSLVKSRSFAHVAEQVLRISLRSPPGEAYAAGESLDSPVAAPPGTLGDLLDKAADTRAELKSVDATLRALGHQKAITRAAYFPSISASGAAEYSNPNPRIFPQEDKFTGTWQIGAQLTWSPNDLMTTAAQVDQQAAGIAQTQAQRQQAADGIVLETTQAFEDFGAAKASVDSSLRQLTASQEAFRVARVRLDHAIGADLK
jgi:outer membrane protein TolC